MSRPARAIAGGALAVIVAIAIAVILIGGGDDEASTAPDALAPEVLTTGAPSAELQDCLGEQGLEGFPEVAPTEGGQPDADRLDALQACAEFLPQGAPQGGFPGTPPQGFPGG